jgi:hypothetical protein
MEKSHSQVANSHSASPEISCLSQNPTSSKEPASGPCPEPDKSIKTLGDTGRKYSLRIPEQIYDRDG